MKLSLQDALERGETVTALIEFGYPLYFAGPIGFDLLTVIARADAQRDNEPTAATRSVLDY